MKSFKKVLGLVFALVIVLGISACGKEQRLNLKIDNKSTVEIESAYLQKEGDNLVLGDAEIDENDSFSTKLDKKIKKDDIYTLNLDIGDNQLIVLEIKMKEENIVEISGNEAEIKIKVNGGKEQTFKKKMIELEEKEEDVKDTNTSNNADVNIVNTQSEPKPQAPQPAPAPTQQMDKNQDNCVTDALLND